MQLAKPEVCRCCFLRKGSNAEIICSPSSELFLSILVVSVLISIFRWLALPLRHSMHTHNTCSTESSQTPASSCLPRSAHTSLTASPLLPSYLISIWLTACGTQTHFDDQYHLLLSQTHTCRHKKTYTHLSFFVAFADIKKEKAAGSMQNNEVKAILISLGDEPDASRERRMINEEEKNKRKAVL